MNNKRFSNENDEFRRAYANRSKFKVGKLVSETTGLDTYYTYVDGGNIVKEFTQTIAGERYVIAFKDSSCKIPVGIVLLDGYKLRSPK